MERSTCPLSIVLRACLTNRSRVQQWPRQFYVHIMNDRCILREVQAWVKQYTPPLCTFLPDRLRETNTHAVNQANFRSLSRILFENQTVNIVNFSLLTMTIDLSTTGSHRSLGNGCLPWSWINHLSRPTFKCFACWSTLFVFRLPRFCCWRNSVSDDTHICFRYASSTPPIHGRVAVLLDFPSSSSWAFRVPPFKP